MDEFMASGGATASAYCKVPASEKEIASDEVSVSEVTTLVGKLKCKGCTIASCWVTKHD